MKVLLMLSVIITAVGCGGAQNGQNGQMGPQGLDGTTITPVQFCQGVTPTYPNTFPESGLCIDGSIYAVYSQYNGFLALIPPGEYTSQAVGSACNFTVLPNCVVQDQ